MARAPGFGCSRRRFLQGSLAVAGLGLFTGCGFGRLPAKVPRLGYLSVGSREGRSQLDQQFLQELGKLGYVDGENVTIERRYAGDDYGQFPELARELVGLEVDIIVTSGGTPPTVAAKQATQSIPIVFATLGDPIGLGLATSLAHPGGNVTGFSILAPDLAGKRVEIIRTIVPQASQLAVLSNPANASHAGTLKDIDEAARSVGVQLQPLEARGPDDFEGAFQAARQGGADALEVQADGLFVVHRMLLPDLLLKHRLPTMFETNDFIEPGGLMAYGATLSERWERAANYVDKILKGAKPADLPVEQPTKFDFSINLRTARALGLTIPQSALQQATEVVQ